MLTCVEAATDGTHVVLNELNSGIEEVDMRIISHVYHAILKGTERVMLSNDIDVVILLFYYMPRFLFQVLLELGVEYVPEQSNERFLPLLVLSRGVGHGKCKVILKVHILTGYIVTSKVCTKVHALKADPEMYLPQHGEDQQLLEEVAEKAEQNLVKVLQPDSLSKTFNQLRFEYYMNKTTALQGLPLTSHSL